MSDRSCIVCGGAYGAFRIEGLVQCAACGFVAADLQLSYDELASLYSAKYFAGEEYKDYLSERPLIERQFKLRLETLLRFVDNPARKRLFEIGSAYGFFLAVAQRRFAAVEGIDISADAAAYARNSLQLPVSTGDFLEHSITQPVDVVCLWDTIEHLAEPHRYIEKAAAIMPSGGLIAMTTGDIGSFVARWRGRKWRQIHPPTHLHYFSRFTLQQLLDRYGFTIRYIGHDGMYRSIDTMVHIILSIRRRQHTLYRWLRRLGVLNGAVYLNLRDIVFVVAEKR